MDHLIDEDYASSFFQRLFTREEKARMLAFASKTNPRAKFFVKAPKPSGVSASQWASAAQTCMERAVFDPESGLATCPINRLAQEINREAMKLVEEMKAFNVLADFGRDWFTFTELEKQQILDTYLPGQEGWPPASWPEPAQADARRIAAACATGPASRKASSLE